MSNITRKQFLKGILGTIVIATFPTILLQSKRYSVSHQYGRGRTTVVGETIIFQWTLTLEEAAQTYHGIRCEDEMIGIMIDMQGYIWKKYTPEVTLEDIKTIQYQLITPDGYIFRSHTALNGSKFPYTTIRTV